LKLKKAESKENYGKCLVLQIFEIVGEAVRPTLGPKGQSSVSLKTSRNRPESRKQKAMRSEVRATLTQRAFGEDEKTGEDDAESGEMVVEFAFFLVGQELGRSVSSSAFVRPSP